MRPVHRDGADPLLAAVDLVWPAPVPAGPRRRGTGAAELVMVPNRRDPRMLLPAGRRAGAAAALRWGAGDHVPAQLLVAALIGTGLDRLVLRDRLWVCRAGSLVEQLGELLGEPVVVGLRTGAVRANRKPVLQALRPDGTVLAYAKIGRSALTDALVGTEQAALELLARRPVPGLSIPRLLGRFSWLGSPVLVVSALPVPRLRSTRSVPPSAELVRGVAGLCPGAAELTQAPFWVALGQGLAALAAEPEQVQTRLGVAAPERPPLRPGDGEVPALPALVEAASVLARRLAGTELALGAWHGDWTRWNSARHGSRLLLWDWERFAGGVPVGFDALHHRLSTLRFDHRLPVRAACLRLHAEAPALLHGLPCGQAHPHDLAVLYLLTLAGRYATDGTAQDGHLVRRNAALIAGSVLELVGTGAGTLAGREAT